MTNLTFPLTLSCGCKALSNLLERANALLVEYEPWRNEKDKVIGMWKSDYRQALGGAK